jgi:hypothetical protein
MVLKDYWIDPEELAQLGAELNDESDKGILNQSKEPVVNLFGDTLQGSLNENESSQLDLEKIGEQLAAIKQRAQNSGLLRSSELKPEVEPDFIDSVAGTTLVDRLESFVKWAYRQNLLTGIFITDMSGKELVDSGADPVIVNSGIELATGNLQERQGIKNAVTEGISTTTDFRDWKGSVLTVFCSRSSYGEHVLGTLSRTSLSTGLSLGLRKGFGRVMGSN